MEKGIKKSDRLGGNMGKKLASTPRSRVRQALRQLWLRSRERAAALKREGNTCQHCKRKASKAKGKEFSVEVHHIEGIANWDVIIDTVFEFLLCDPSMLEVLCKECHDKEHTAVTDDTMAFDNEEVVI